MTVRRSTASSGSAPRKRSRCPYCGHRCRGVTCQYCKDLRRLDNLAPSK